MLELSRKCVSMAILLALACLANYCDQPTASADDGRASRIAALEKLRGMQFVTEYGQPHPGGLKIQTDSACTDEDLANLLPIAQAQGQVLSLDLSGSPNITDAGLAAVGRQSGLEELAIGGPITDAGLVHLRGLTELRKIAMVSGRITGSGLVHLAAARHLESLDLRYAANDAVMEDLRLWPNLKVLKLPFSGITDHGLQHLGDVGELRYLEIYGGTRLTDVWLTPLGRLTKLEELHLGELHLEGAGLANLGPLAKLRALGFGGRDFKSSNLVQLKGMKNLERLGIRSITVDGGLGGLSALAGLKKLALSYMEVTDRDLAALEALTNLEALEVTFTGISGTGFERLKGLKKLTDLDLSNDVYLNDSGMAALGSLKSLNHLVLGDDEQISDDGFKHLSGLVQLQELELGGTRLTDKGLAYLAPLRELRRLGLEDCGITDEGLIHIGGMEHLEAIDLRSSKRVTAKGLKFLHDYCPKLKTAQLDDENYILDGELHVKYADAPGQ